MEIARGWQKRVIRTNIAYAKQTVHIFSISPQSCSLFSASFQTFCLTAGAYLNTQKYGLFCSLIFFMLWANLVGMEFLHKRYKAVSWCPKTSFISIQACAEEAFGVVEDTEIREKYAKLNHELKMYQNQEKEIQAREKAILEKEEMYRQVGINRILYFYQLVCQRIRVI